MGDFGLATKPPKGSDVAIMAETSDVKEHDPVDLCGHEITSAMEKSITNDHEAAAATYSLNSNIHITAGVGTAFYRAPEQERAGIPYNQKADMFSLGILFFEMWSPPFTTLMERAEALIQLRDHKMLPSSWSTCSSASSSAAAGVVVPENVQRIIEWLCDPDPAARPTAAELLASPLLPPKMEVEEKYLKEALATLANPQGTFFIQLMQALFMQEPLDYIDYTYDGYLLPPQRSTTTATKLSAVYLEGHVRSHIKKALQVRNI